MAKLRVHDAEDIMRGWKAYYGDGTVLTSEFNKWADIPVNNFQYLKVHYDRHTDTFAGLSLFCISEDPDEIKRLIDENPNNIKIGKLIDNWAEFEINVEEDKTKVMKMI